MRDPVPFGVKLLFVSLAILLVSSILWAAYIADFKASLGLILHDPWGIVTLIDLYSGLIFAGFVIYILEGRRPISLLWMVSSFFLGNIVTAVWLVLRGPHLLKNATKPG